MITDTFRDSLKHPASIILGASLVTAFFCCADLEQIKTTQEKARQILRDPAASTVIVLAGIGALIVVDKSLPHVDALFRLALGKSQ